MKQLTRQEVEAVVERIKNPNPILQCPECDNDCVKCTNCGSTLWKNDHTYIGTILDKIVVKFTDYMIYSSEDDYGYIEALVKLWRPLNLSRSLQDITANSKWEEKACLICEQEGKKHNIECPSSQELLTSPEANALFSFLQEIL